MLSDRDAEERLTAAHVAEINAGARFAFGRNWSRFLAGLSNEQIAQAEHSLCKMLKVRNLEGKTFLDIGSGSGLFSLAARRLGATVHSFDYDPLSVACTAELRRRHFPDHSRWFVEQGSVLDEKFMSKIGRYDVVYSWGVLHHTGYMTAAFENVASAVAPGGQLFIAIYNDQGSMSRYWSLVKRIYNQSGVGRYVVVMIHAPYLFGLRWLVRALTGRLSLERGMSIWHDMIDWLGGYPFEVAKPEAVLRFFGDRGYAIEELVTCGARMGCNEFVFRRSA